MVDASLPRTDMEVINVDDDDDDNGDSNNDEWQSLFHVSQEAVEGVISSRKNEGVKRKKILPCLHSLPPRGKR
jgi:hypothetical protein